MRAHGTHAKYALDHCRCDPCRLAQREYNRRRYRAISRPDEIWQPYIDADPIREHVRWLATCGIGLKTLAKLAGVSHGTLSKLMYGDPTRHMAPSKRVRPATAHKITAVMPNMAAGAQRVPAAPTWRLLNELIAIGWSRAELARRLGHQGPGLQIRHDRILASTARQVEQLHANLIPIRVIPKKTRWGLRLVPVLPHRQAS